MGTDNNDEDAAEGTPAEAETEADPNAEGAASPRKSGTVVGRVLLGSAYQRCLGQ
jgi:hypothetical protein